MNLGIERLRHLCRWGARGVNMLSTAGLLPFAIREG